MTPTVCRVRGRRSWLWTRGVPTSMRRVAPGRGQLPEDEWYACRYEQIVSDPMWLVLVAEDGDTPIGYALAQDYGPGLRATFTIGRSHDLYVAPEHRRKGAARALMAAKRLTR